MVGNDLVPALAYTDLVGELVIGDQVWLNQRALSLNLGTGGQALVVAPFTDHSDLAAAADTGSAANHSTQPAPTNPCTTANHSVHPTPVDTAITANHSTQPAPPATPSDLARGTNPASGTDPASNTDSGYLVKARYTPLQVAVRGVDSPHSPHHQIMQQADSLEGMPVVTADLHSSLPAICAGALASNPTLRVAYVMLDAAALPAAYSRTIHQLRQAEMLTAVITAGQAYGGDYEAVSVHSALLAARHVVQADLAVVAQGPGNLGSHTPWGFSGLAVGEAINAIALLQGKPIGCLRVSGADPRPRHYGLSHHSMTSYGKVALAPADLVLPILTGQLAELGGPIRTAVLELTKPKGRHNLVKVSTDGLLAVLGGLSQQGIGLSTMGRSLADDPAAFLAAAAAGRHAAALASGGVADTANNRD
ncbi:MAG: DUF3866 family protein [Micrococcales bacterium]|nr:DUF3866 family protein [Micrococcales bacterium]